MHPTPYESDADWQLLQDELRRLAQTELLPRFRHVSAEKKTDGSLLTEADEAMQQACQRFLRKSWPQLAFLGEESPPRGAAGRAAIGNRLLGAGSAGRHHQFFPRLLPVGDLAGAGAKRQCRAGTGL